MINSLLASATTPNQTINHRKPKLAPGDNPAARRRKAKRDAIIRVLNQAGKRPRRDKDLVRCVWGGMGVRWFGRAYATMIVGVDGLTNPRHK